MRDHTCHADRCEVQVPPAMFMCKRHWFMLPKAMRDAVWSEYVFGQEDRMDPTVDYLNVTARAIRWLAIKEGHGDPVALPVTPLLFDGSDGS